MPTSWATRFLAFKLLIIIFENDQFLKEIYYFHLLTHAINISCFACVWWISTEHSLEIGVGGCLVPWALIAWSLKQRNWGICFLCMADCNGCWGFFNWSTAFFFFFLENNWLPLECKPLMLFVIEPLYSLLLINKQLVLLEAIFLDIFCFNWINCSLYFYVFMCWFQLVSYSSCHSICNKFWLVKLGIYWSKEKERR